MAHRETDPPPPPASRPASRAVPEDGVAGGGGAGELERRLAESETDRLRWKARGLDAERRYREREVALRRLREELAELRADRDAWREQAERLTSMLGAAPGPAPGARERLRAEARRTVRAAWRIVPEPGRRLARPILERVRGRASERAGTDPPGEPQVAPAAPVATEGDERLSRAAPRVVDESVSLIIPTLNAGPEFRRSLEAIGRQRGIGDLELLVADSGSVDGTPELARAFGARVVDVPPGEFSHGATRDRMATMAEGEVLVMTVQDAVLGGSHVLRDLVLHLTSDPGLAAVTARQVPRIDADLFGAFLIFASARSTAAHRPDDEAGGWYAALTLPERRVSCTVDNVCAAYRRAAWEALRFRDVTFAEDLDFGIRAVEQGWKVAVCHDAPVVHSHRRDAAYHMGRFLVDRLRIAAMLGDPDVVPAAASGLDAVVAASVELVERVEGAVAAARGGAEPPTFGPYLESVASLVATGSPRTEPSGELAAVRVLLGEVGPSPDGRAYEVLRDDLLMLLGSPVLKEFAGLHPHADRSDAEGFVAKAAALVVGQALGEAMRDHEPESPLALRILRGI